MSGKIHSVIGTVVTAVIGSAILSLQSTRVDMSVLAVLVGGALVGSLAPDIDSKRSIASQKVTSAVCGVLVVFFIFFIPGIIDAFRHNSRIGDVSFYVANSFDSPAFAWIKKIIEQVSDVRGLLLFIIVLFLGKFSPHRQFTHKWLGTLLFCFAAYLTFNKLFTIGFIAGYLLHIIADATTPAGIKFLETTLPMQRANGNYTHVDLHYKR